MRTSSSPSGSRVRRRSRAKPPTLDRTQRASGFGRAPFFIARRLASGRGTHLADPCGRDISEPTLALLPLALALVLMRPGKRARRDHLARQPRYRFSPCSSHAFMMSRWSGTFSIMESRQSSAGIVELAVLREPSEAEASIGIPEVLRQSPETEDPGLVGDGGDGAKTGAGAQTP